MASARQFTRDAPDLMLALLPPAWRVQARRGQVPAEAVCLQTRRKRHDPEDVHLWGKGSLVLLPASAGGARGSPGPRSAADDPGLEKLTTTGRVGWGGWRLARPVSRPPGPPAGAGRAGPRGRSAGRAFRKSRHLVAHGNAGGLGGFHHGAVGPPGNAPRLAAGVPGEGVTTSGTSRIMRVPRSSLSTGVIAAHASGPGTGSSPAEERSAAGGRAPHVWQGAALEVRGTPSLAAHGAEATRPVSCPAAPSRARGHRGGSGP